MLRGDDGFGLAVIQALSSATRVPQGLHAAEVGIGGISLVHELMDGYEALVLGDAVDRAAHRTRSTFWSRKGRM